MRGATMIALVVGALRVHGRTILRIAIGETGRRTLRAVPTCLAFIGKHAPEVGTRGPCADGRREPLGGHRLKAGSMRSRWATVAFWGAHRAEGDRRNSYKPSRGRPKVRKLMRPGMSAAGQARMSSSSRIPHMSKRSLTECALASSHGGSTRGSGIRYGSARQSSQAPCG